MNENNKMNEETVKNIINKTWSLEQVDDIILSHQSLVGKKCLYSDDCGEYFLIRLLDKEIGHDNGFEYTKTELEFVKSKYVSNYMKEYYKKLINVEILNSNVNFNDMQEQDLKDIYTAINDYYEKNPEKRGTGIFSSFISYITKLDGEGIKEYIKNDVNKTTLASYILITSGLSSNPSYYSGRGVNKRDLNAGKLLQIYKKILHIDMEYAMNFTEVISSMEFLGATEFIKTFLNFANNDFKCENLEISQDNINLEGLVGKAKEYVAMASLYSVNNINNNQLTESIEIKQRFFEELKHYLIRLKNSKKTESSTILK